MTDSKVSGILPKEQGAALQREYESLDSFELDKRIQRRLRKNENDQRARRSRGTRVPRLPTALDNLSANRYLNMQFNDLVSAELWYF